VSRLTRTAAMNRMSHFGIKYEDRIGVGI
jgi:hypothetical protein